jgi:hypothetical protein
MFASEGQDFGASGAERVRIGAFRRHQPRIARAAFLSRNGVSGHMLSQPEARSTRTLFVVDSHLGATACGGVGGRGRRGRVRRTRGRALGRAGL